MWPAICANRINMPAGIEALGKRLCAPGGGGTASWWGRGVRYSNCRKSILDSAILRTAPTIDFDAKARVPYVLSVPPPALRMSGWGSVGRD